MSEIPPYVIVKIPLPRDVGYGDGPFMTHSLPVEEVSPGIHIAVLNLRGDWSLAETMGKSLSERVLPDVEVLVMPAGKAENLLHVIARERNLPAVVPVKEYRAIMGEGCLKVSYRSKTTNREQTLYLTAEDVEMIRGRRVAFIDDVISTGDSWRACQDLIAQAGGIHHQALACFTEGDPRPEVTTLGHLEVYKS